MIQLAANLSNQPAIPLSASAEIADFAAVNLVFAWVRSPNVPLILGQTNFFLEFDVCLVRHSISSISIIKAQSLRFRQSIRIN
ncbi:hypothetical protein [Nostoc sp. MS1]|uniref:hypothetical protein n=1 Tax=Nostoc sp. MS1 TaxID=2764711 RepID=UPI001CC3C243|nr:hypothetical protein [Nostoc sp. MS1]